MTPDIRLPIIAPDLYALHKDKILGELSSLNGLEKLTLGMFQKILPETLFTLHDSRYPGTPDFSFDLAGFKFLIFVDGDFWHPKNGLMDRIGIKAFQGGETEKGEFWIEKAHFNREYDLGVMRKLRSMEGIKVLRLKEARLQSKSGFAYLSKALAFSLHPKPPKAKSAKKKVSKKRSSRKNQTGRPTLSDVF